MNVCCKEFDVLEGFAERWKWPSIGVAVLVLVALIWTGWGRLGSVSVNTMNSGELKQTYQQLLADSAVSKGSWMRTLSPGLQDIEGDIAWDNQTQQGVMRFVNLPEPRKGYQYQVWIFDSRSKTGQPVSGAILEHGSGKQELLVALQAAEPVAEPYKFVLQQEPLSGNGEAQILLMAQP